MEERGQPVPRTGRKKHSPTFTPRTDVRRFRRVDPNGPRPKEQAKLLGSGAFSGSRYTTSERRKRLLKQTLEEEAADPDMTPLPRRLGRTIVRYLPGKTTLGEEVAGEFDFDE